MRKFNSVLITGAGSGIGEAIAGRFARQGSSLSLTLIGRNAERLEAVTKRCIALGAKARWRQVDMSDPDSIDAFVDELKEQKRVFDCLVLNAGISQRALTLETDFSVDRKIMETNYFGPVCLTKKLGYMLKDNPYTAIAVTNSISGLFGFPLRSAYCASKHALFGFFETLELENDNIHVTFLIPGRINTPISRSAVLGNGETYGQMDSGQANGLDVEKCAEIAVRAIEKGKHRQLIGGKELLMVHFRKWMPPLFRLLARKVSAT